MSSIRWMVAVGLLLNVSGQVLAQPNDDFVPVLFVFALPK